MNLRSKLLLNIPALFWLVSCVLDYDPGTNDFPYGRSSSSSELTSSSSSALSGPRSSSSSQKSTASSSSATSGSASANSVDTLPTWRVPFTESVSRVQINPVGAAPDMVLAAFGTRSVKDFLSATDWKKLFPNRAGINRLCDGSTDFYSYEAFLTALKDFPAFAAEGPDVIRKRELAAFLAQISHETSGGAGSYDTGSDRYNWGLCWTEEIGYSSGSMAYRDENSTLWPAAPGKSYHGRGPIQLTWNYNYGQAGSDLGVSLLINPDWVLESGANAFRTSLWFWMKEQTPKPSAHAAIVEYWAPTEADKRYNRWPGYGIITNIINGGGECGIGSETRNAPRSRVGYYKRYTKYLGVDPGRNVECYQQRDFRFQ